MEWFSFINLHKIIILFFSDAVIGLNLNDSLTGHREGDTLIFCIDLLFLGGDTNAEVNYVITLTGLTAAGELLFHSLCIVQNFIVMCEKFYCKTRSMAQVAV